MRAVCLVIALGLCGPALAQSLDGSINSALFGNIGTGLQSGFDGSLSGAVGSQQRSRSITILQSEQFTREDDTRNFFQLQELERQGLDLTACATGQVDVNHTGCRPIGDVVRRAPTFYDTSVEALKPLGGLVLQGQTLTLGAGPQGPLD